MLIIVILISYLFLAKAQTTVPIRKFLQEETLEEFYVLLIGSPIPSHLKSIGMIETYLENATDFDCYMNHPPPHSITEGGEIQIIGYSGVRKGTGDTCIYIPLVYSNSEESDVLNVKEFKSYADEKFLYLTDYVYENLDRLNKNVVFTSYLIGISIGASFGIYFSFFFILKKMKKPEADLHENHDVEMGIVNKT